MAFIEVIQHEVSEGELKKFMMISLIQEVS